MPQGDRFRPAGPVRAGVYELLWRGADLLQKASNACLHLAAGVLREQDLRTASRVRWTAYGLAVEDAPSGLEPWERQVYGEVLQPGDRVLIVGCGTGRDVLALCERGYRVTGIDQAGETLAVADRHLRERRLEATLIPASVENAMLGGACFDAVIFSSGCFSSLPRSASRVAALRRVAERLASGGRVVIEYTGAVASSRLARGLTSVSARLSRSDWRPEPGDVFSRDPQTRDVLRYEHRFAEGEIGAECAAAGLTVVGDRTTRAPYRCAVAVRCTPRESPAFLRAGV